MAALPFEDDFRGSVGILQDDLNTETGRDRYLYRVKRHLTGEVLPIDFRHGDLVATTLLEEHSSEDDH